MNNKKLYVNFLWIGAILMIIGQVFHPTGDAGSIDRLTWAEMMLSENGHSMIAHIAFIISFPIILVGLVGLFTHLARPAETQFALTMWGVASLSGMIAVIFNLFVPWSLAQNYVGATIEMRPFIDAQIGMSDILGEWFAMGLFFGIPLVFAAIAGGFLHSPAVATQRFGQLMGGSGALLSLASFVAAVGIQLGATWAMPFEGIVVLLIAVWFIAAGFWLRQREATINKQSHPLVAAVG